jgi:hypothetical protein
VASIMCHAVESGARQVSLQQGGRLYEDYLNVLTRSLKLSSGLSVIIGFSLAQSQFKSLSQDAIRFLRVKLPELNSLTAISDMSEDILQQIYHFITTCEVWSVASNFENISVIQDIFVLFTNRSWRHRKFPGLLCRLFGPIHYLVG